MGIDFILFMVFRFIFLIPIRIIYGFIKHFIYIFIKQSILFMKRNTLLTLLSLLTLYFLPESANAQVTIGAGTPPHPGAVLELVSNTHLGLLMPRISLTDAGDWGLEGSPANGMTVYNDSPSTANNLSGKGIYIWTDGRWSPSFESSAQPACAGAPSIGTIHVSNASPAKNIAFQAWVDPVADNTTQYIWTTTGVPKMGYSNTNIISLAGLASGSLTISVNAVNSCGRSTSQSITIKIQ
jgi:hypothetical protein